MAIIEINRNPTRRDLAWFGALLPVFFALVGAIVWRRTGGTAGAIGVWGAGAGLAGLYALWPASRRPVYIGWMHAVFPIGWVISHLLLGVIYYLVITPIGLVLRVSGRSPLDRGFDPARPSYWVRRRPVDRVDRYLRQF